MKFANHVHFAIVFTLMLFFRFNDVKIFRDCFLIITLYDFYDVNFLKFQYNFISLKKDKIPSMSTFSYSSFILFTLKKSYLIRAKCSHSIRKCLIVSSV